jgi:pyruvate formate lyase activating enzyme
VTLVYANPCLIRPDPVERTPFFHVLPGTRTLSVSTAGCPLACMFCEAWDMALAAPEEVYAYDIPPERVVDHALELGARSVSYACGEPVAFYEYTADVAALARKAGLLNLVHTSGYIAREPLAALAGMLDAVNVDLKGFDPAFYRDICGGELAPVLQALRLLGEAGVHVEITNLVIPTLNDDMERIGEMCRWIRRELGAGVPVHFARFYPLYRLANLPPTPVSTLDRARAAALDAGLQYVYVARVTGHEGENTFCPRCGRPVIRRTGFVVEETRLEKGACGWCGAPVPGRWR